VLEAVVSIELTRDDKGNPNNRVHFHFVTDDPRSEDDLRVLFNMTCQRAGLVRGQDFRILIYPLWEGNGYFYYFTKCGHSDKVILFQPHIKIQKFYEIGNWFRKTQKELWKEFLCAKYGTKSQLPNNRTKLKSTGFFPPCSDNDLSCTAAIQGGFATGSVQRGQQKRYSSQQGIFHVNQSKRMNSKQLHSKQSFLIECAVHQVFHARLIRDSACSKKDSMSRSQIQSLVKQEIENLVKQEIEKHGNEARRLFLGYTSGINGPSLNRRINRCLEVVCPELTDSKASYTPAITSDNTIKRQQQTVFVGYRLLTPVEGGLSLIQDHFADQRPPLVKPDILVDNSDTPEFCDESNIGPGNPLYESALDKLIRATPVEEDERVVSPAYSGKSSRHGSLGILPGMTVQEDGTVLGGDFGQFSDSNEELIDC